MRSLTAVLAAALVLVPATPAWAANQAPVAVDDTVAYRNFGGIDYIVPALGNDSDPDGDPLTYTAVTPATKGDAYLREGKLFYKPYITNEGTDSFTYTVTDGQGNTSTATVTATLWVDPAEPGNATISSAAPGSVTLHWSAAARATRYEIYRDGIVVDTTAALSWTDEGLLDTGDYDYRIVAVNAGGYRGWPSRDLYRRPQLPTPGDVSVGRTDDPTTVSLTWDVGGMYGPWLVYRDGSPVGTSPTASFEDTGLVTGREYSYQVQVIGPTLTSTVWPPSKLSSPVTGTPGPLTPIERLFQELGGPSGGLGAVTVAERTIPGGRQRYHQNGLILQQDGEAALAVMQPLAAAYLSSGGAIGDLGFPVAEADCGLRDFGCGQFFEGGSIWDASYTPTVVVPQVIEDGWAASGWEEGPLGYPVDDVVELPDGFGQEFEGGGVFWSAATGSHAVHGAIGELWMSVEETDGRLRYPTTGEICGLRGGGCGQAFQGGSIHWSPATGAQVTTGAIRNAWARSGWENGAIGYPTTSEICGLRGRGCGQAFQGGSIHWSPGTGAHATTTGAIRSAWARSGWENGGLSFPTTGEICGLRGGGCGQGFQGGSIHWSPGTGAQVTMGAIRDAWARSGWENGRLGYPVSGATLSGGVYRQTFQGGTITSDSRVTRINYR